MLKKSWSEFWVLLALIAASTLTMLAETMSLSWILGKLGGAFSELEKVSESELMSAIGIFVVLNLLVDALLAVLSYSSVRLGRRVSLAAANHLRRDFFAHLLSLPYGHFLEHNAGGQANTWLNDVDDIDRSINGFFEQGDQGGDDDHSVCRGADGLEPFDRSAGLGLDAVDHLGPAPVALQGSL